MICEGAPLDESQAVGWCCGRKEIPVKELHKVRLSGTAVPFPFCKIWIAEMKRRDAEYETQYGLNKKKGK